MEECNFKERTKDYKGDDKDQMFVCMIAHTYGDYDVQGSFYHRLCSGEENCILWKNYNTMLKLKEIIKQMKL